MVISFSIIQRISQIHPGVHKRKKIVNHSAFLLSNGYNIIMYAMIFMMIFGAAIILTAGIIALEKDPRDSVFLARVHGLKEKSLEEAGAIAKKIAKILAIVGICLIVVFGTGLIIYFMTDPYEKGETDRLIQDVQIEASVRNTGQYPERFLIHTNGSYSQDISASDFHMEGSACACGSNSSHRFECGFVSVSVDGKIITLIPADFPEKFFYVRDYEVTCSSDPQLSFSDEDVTKITTAVADDFKTYSSDKGFDYHLYTPENGDNMPVVIVFHGYGDTDNLLTYRTAVEWADPENQAVRPCYVIAPSIPDDMYFDPDGRKTVIDEIMNVIHSLGKDGKIDLSRIYVMGNSFGGVASIETAERYPDGIAGVLALCPALNYADEAKRDLPKIKDIPIWFLHAENDGTISSEESKKAFKSLQDAGAHNVRIKLFTDEEMNDAGAFPDSESTYSYHHVELAVMEDDTYMEWLYGSAGNAQ